MKKTLKATITIYEIDREGNKSLYSSYEGNTFTSWEEGIRISEREATHLCKELSSFTNLKYKHYVQLEYIELV